MSIGLAIAPENKNRRGTLDGHPATSLHRMINSISIRNFTMFAHFPQTPNEGEQPKAEPHPKERRHQRQFAGHPVPQGKERPHGITLGDCADALAVMQDIKKLSTEERQQLGRALKALQELERRTGEQLTEDDVQQLTAPETPGFTEGDISSPPDDDTDSPPEPPDFVKLTGKNLQAESERAGKWMSEFVSFDPLIQAECLKWATLYYRFYTDPTFDPVTRPMQNITPDESDETEPIEPEYDDPYWDELVGKDGGDLVLTNKRAEFIQEATFVAGWLVAQDIISMIPRYEGDVPGARFFEAIEYISVAMWNAKRKSRDDYYTFSTWF